MIGYINKLETMSTVDGPGLRVAVFMQGCRMRCKFCHNPETWALNKGIKYTPEELCNTILKYKNYIEEGGVTFSGGEPLLQEEFLLEVLKLCKKNNLHTCIDTTGSNFKNKEILNYTDLVLLDIKALDDNSYIEMSGQDMKEFWKFIEACEEFKKEVWIRQVIIPTINDNEEYILKLKELLKPYKCIKKIELLPYHTMAISKYKELGIPYRLENIKSMDKEKCRELENKLN